MRVRRARVERALRASREEVEGVRGGRGDDVLLRMPRHVKDFARSEISRRKAEEFVDIAGAGGADVVSVSSSLRSEPTARILADFKLSSRFTLVVDRGVEALENVSVRAGGDVRAVVVDATLEFVENGVILVQIAQFGTETLSNVDDCHGCLFHVQIPQLQGEVVSREEVPTVSTKFDIADAGYDFGEETFLLRWLWKLKQLAVRVAHGVLAQICQTNRPLTRRVRQIVAIFRMKFGARDDFAQVFHVGRLYVHNVETLLIALEMPHVDSQIIRTDEGFPVAVHAQRVDVIRVRVGVRAPIARREDALSPNDGWNLQRPRRE